MIQKIKQICRSINYFGQDPDSDAFDYMIGHRSDIRPHSKTILVISVSLASLSLFLPDMGIFAFLGLMTLGYPINHEYFLPKLRRLGYSIKGRLGLK